MHLRSPARIYHFRSLHCIVNDDKRYWDCANLLRLSRSRDEQEYDFSIPDLPGKVTSALLGLFLSNEHCSSNGAYGNDMGGIREISFCHPSGWAKSFLNCLFRSFCCQLQIPSYGREEIMSTSSLGTLHIFEILQCKLEVLEVLDASATPACS